jgi:hypothetical protein
MRGCALVVMVMLAGCPPRPPNTGPIEYVGGTDPHPGVPADPPPDPPVAPAELPSEHTPISAAPRCALITPTAPLESFHGALPTDVSPDAAYNAILQFLTTSGEDIAAQDPIARTVITKRFSGQTLTSTCAINRYFVFALRIAVSGSVVIVSMSCENSLGWEAGVSSGMAQRNRGELTPCDVPAYVSKGDAGIPEAIFKGAIELLSLGRMAKPESLPPPSAEELRNAHWWCAKLGRGDGATGACYRSRIECDRRRKSDSSEGAVLSDCFPLPQAQCFEVQTVEPGGRFQSCQPTPASCQSQRAYAQGRREARLVGDCHAVD